MREALVFTLAFAVVVTVSSTHGTSFAEKNTFYDSVKFIQYLDENTALEEVRNGNLDLYYYTISPDRLESSKEERRGGLQVFDSAGGSYSILVNPAESKEFNPFSNREVRFALNYLVDRKLIVNELMGGYGFPVISYYGPTQPEYLTVVNQLESYNFKYNPMLADQIISKALKEETGVKATKTDGIWHADGNPVEITVFIRSDDPVRKSIGEILSAELEKIGFTVNKEFGDLNKAFVVVYGSNPSDVKWNIYTEAWLSSAFVKYDSSGLGQMYAPWYSYMPGFNDPTYWNYENEMLDSITQKIYTGDFETAKQRAALIQDAVVEGIDESVRIFLASKINQYVANKDVSGIVNDFGTGVPSRFTPINAKNNDDDSNNNKELAIGVKQIYQGAWNPVMGFTDSYSVQIWNIVSDPATFKHPFTGETIPVRATWEVQTDSSADNSTIRIPKEAKTWSPALQKWKIVDDDSYATSMVTYDFKFSKWHNGEKMDINDILHSLYFTIEWGTQTDKTDKTFDAEFTPRAAQGIQTIKGVNPTDEDTIEVYVDYGHFDEGEIAGWAELWSTVPWEITAAMEKAVTDGRASFSKSGAASKNVNWLSLIIPKDADTIKEYLREFKETRHVPKSLAHDDWNNQGSEHRNDDYHQSRYESSIDWIENKQHAVISNGPYYLESYSPESRTIKVTAHDDDTYPFVKGEWSKFEDTKFPSIKKIDIKQVIQRGDEISIRVETRNADSILYFLTNGSGESIISDSQDVQKKDNTAVISISPESSGKLGIGANNIKIFAISNSVLKPDFHEMSFIASENAASLPENSNDGDIVFSKTESGYEMWVVVVAVIIIIIVVIISATAVTVSSSRLKKQSHSKP